MQFKDERTGQPVQQLTFRRTPRKALVFIVVLTLIGALVGLVVNKATAATPQPQQEQQVEVECATQDAGACKTPTRKAKRFKRKYHNGDLGHANGFSPKRLFAEPKKARRIIVRRIARMLRAQRSASTARMAAGDGYRLRARGIYYKMVHDSECSTPFNSSQWSAMSGPHVPRNCDMMDRSDVVSTATIVNTIAVTACIGSVGVTMLTPVGRGASLALKFWGVTFGVTSCTTMAMLAGMD